MESLERQVVLPENLVVGLWGDASVPLLRSVTVGELVRRLDAGDLLSGTLELLVDISIGAMNVIQQWNSSGAGATAVVTGADRTDIQLAALEASTQCRS